MNQQQHDGQQNASQLNLVGGSDVQQPYGNQGPTPQGGYMGGPPQSMGMMVSGPSGQPMMQGLYGQQPNEAGGNANGNNQMLQMGYMHDGHGQYMMGHGQNGGQLPAGDPGVPHMVGAMGDAGGQIPNMGANGGQGQTPYGGGGGQDEDSGDNDGGGKGKRRSKNDVEGRDFKCSYCPKTYLSYPALYTHIKQKHSKGPDGEVRAPPTSGRGRGRPRKNPYHRTDPQKEAYFQQDDKKGGPTDPLLWFHDHYETILKDQYPSIEDYPLYTYLKQFSPSKPGSTKGANESQPEGANKGSKAKKPASASKNRKQDAAAAQEGQDGDEESNQEEGKAAETNGAGGAENGSEVDWQALGWDRNYHGLTEQDKLSMQVDEIFALYLYTVSQKVNDTFYRTVLAFVIFFRECLNEIGWKKRRESDTETKQEDLDELESKQFCLVNTAEHAPEICNEFVTIYMEKNKSKFEIIKCEQIDLTINMCHWLFENQYTCSKLTMIT